MVSRHQEEIITQCNEKDITSLCQKEMHSATGIYSSHSHIIRFRAHDSSGIMANSCEENIELH